MQDSSFRRAVAPVLTGLVTVAAVFVLSFCSRDAKEEPVPALAEIGSYQVSDEEFLGAFRNVFERSGRAL